MQFLQSAMSGQMQGSACATPKATVKKGRVMFGVLKSGAAKAIAKSSKTPATNGSTLQGPAASDASEVPLDPDSELNQSIEEINEDGHLFSAGQLLHLQRHAFVTPAGEEQNEIQLVLGDDSARFEKILVRKTIISDHSCVQLLEDLDSLLAQIAKGEHAGA